MDFYPLKIYTGFKLILEKYINIIRNASIQDLDVIREIALNAYEQYVDIVGKKPAPMIANFSEHLENDKVFVVEGGDGHKPIGYAIVVTKNGDYWLENIAVISTKVKKGVGTQLINYVEEYISKRAKRYQLYTNVKMVQNIDWYRSLGFEETKRYTEDGFERVFFAKKLNR